MVVGELATAMALRAASSGIANKGYTHIHTRATKAVLFFLCNMKVGQVVTILQRPSEEKAEAGNRDEEMEEEKGGPGTGLRSYVWKCPTTVMIHSGRYMAG